MEKLNKNRINAEDIHGLIRKDTKNNSNNSKPIMAWSSEELYDKNQVMIWWSRLDNKYQIEVQRIDGYHANLIIFDHELKDKKIFEKKVGLSYGARFGPDMEDVENWREIAAGFIDNHYKK
jgi:hypothetical protein